MCVYAAYLAAVSQFDVKWVVLTLALAVVVAIGPAHWTIAEPVWPALSWPPMALLATTFIPGWLLMALAGTLKLFGVSPRLVQYLWGGGALWLLVATWRSSRSVTVPERSVATRSAWIWAVIVVAITVALRAWSIGTVPRQVHPDEALTTRLAVEFYANPARDWLGSFGTGMNLYAALPGVGTLLFGYTPTGARTGDVLFGTLSVILLFAALHRLCSLRVAVVGALLLAVNHCDLAYSRSAAGYIQCAFSVTLLFAAAARFWTAPTYFNSVLFGMVAAFGINTAPASVLSLPLVVATLLAMLVVHPQRAQLIGPLLLVGISCVTAGAPFGVSNWQHRDEMLQRSHQLNIFSPPLMNNLKTNVYHTDSTLQVVATQMWNGLTGFHRGHDSQPQYGVLQPLADRYTAALMLPGVVFALFRWRRFVSITSLIFTTGYLLFGLGMHYAPGFQRAVGAVPFGMALAAIGLVECGETLCAARRRVAGWGRDLLLAAAVIVCALTNLHIYFLECRTVLLTGDADSEPGWITQQFAHDYHVHLVDWFAPGPLGMQLITGGIPVSFNQLRDPVAYAKTAAVSGADLFIVHGEDAAARDALLARFPNARLEVRRRHPVHGPTLFLVFVTSPSPGNTDASSRPPAPRESPGDWLIGVLRQVGLGFP